MILFPDCMTLTFNIPTSMHKLQQCPYNFMQLITEILNEVVSDSIVLRKVKQIWTSSTYRKVRALTSRPPGYKVNVLPLRYGYCDQWKQIIFVINCSRIVNISVTAILLID